MLAKKSSVLFSAMLVVALGSLSSVTFSQDKKVINAQTVTTYPPFAFKDLTNNKLTGFDIELVNAMASRMGAEVNWMETSYDQLTSFSALKTRRADMTGSGMGDLPERREIVDFVDTIYDVQTFYTLRSNAGQFKNTEAVCGRRVAVPRLANKTVDLVVKWSEDNCVKSGKPAIDVVFADNAPQVIMALKQGRADAAITGAATVAYQNTLEGNRYATIGKPVMKIMVGVSFRKEDKELSRAFKNALTEMITDGSYEKLLNKWNLPENISIQRAMINGLQ